MGKDGRIALRKAASHPRGDLLFLTNRDVTIPEADCSLRADLIQATGTPGLSGTWRLIGQGKPSGHKLVHLKKLTVERAFP